jgi:uncharacterized protein (TIGR02246 family)
MKYNSLLAESSKETAGINRANRTRISAVFQAPRITRIVVATLVIGCLARVTPVLWDRGVAWVRGMLLAVFVTNLAWGQQAPGLSMSASMQANSEIEQVAESYRKAVLNADVPTILSLYRHDAVEMPYSQQPIVGREAIQAFYEQQFKGPRRLTGFTLAPRETTAQGDIAYNVGNYKRSMSTPSGVIDVTGTYVVILKRTDGAWKVAYSTYTCDCPPGMNTSR